MTGIYLQIVRIDYKYPWYTNAIYGGVRDEGWEEARSGEVRRGEARRGEESGGATSSTHPVHAGRVYFLPAFIVYGHVTQTKRGRHCRGAESILLSVTVDSADESLLS